MHRRTLVLSTWIIIILAAGYLRFTSLEERPIHTDEATGARILADRLETAEYEFNPKHFHGPLLSFLTVPLAQLKGETTWRNLSMGTIRLCPAIAGMLLVLTPLLWRRIMGDSGVLIVAALLSSSPILVYYNRMYIHESWLVLFGMLGAAFAFRLFLIPNWKNAILCGISIGCMFATKETFVIAVFSWVLALALCYTLTITTKITPEDSKRPSFRKYLTSACLVLLTILMTAAFFYSNGFRYPERIWDALQTYLVYETTPGHDKAAGYYLNLLIWPKHLLGQWWTEGLVLLLAGFACLAARRNNYQKTAILYLSVATLVQFLVYSSISYKTPWLILLPWTHLCLLAGLCWQAIPKTSRPAKVILGLVLICTIAFQLQQSVATTQRWENDARAPYVYVPSSRNLIALESWMNQLTVEFPEIQEQTVAVIGDAYWPLPWYLRTFDTIGYWEEPNPAMLQMPIIFSMTSPSSDSDQPFNSTHTAFPQGLRHNVSMTLFVRNDIWKQWSDE